MDTTTIEVIETNARTVKLTEYWWSSESDDLLKVLTITIKGRKDKKECWSDGRKSTENIIPDAMTRYHSITCSESMSCLVDISVIMSRILTSDNDFLCVIWRHNHCFSGTEKQWWLSALYLVPVRSVMGMKILGVSMVQWSSTGKYEGLRYTLKKHKSKISL